MIASARYSAEPRDWPAIITEKRKRLFDGRPVVGINIGKAEHQKLCAILAVELGVTVQWDWCSESAYGPVGMAQGQPRDFKKSAHFSAYGEEMAKQAEPSQSYDQRMAGHQAASEAMFSGGYQASESLLKTLPATPASPTTPAQEGRV